MCTYSLSSPAEKGAVFLRKDRHFIARLRSFLKCKTILILIQSTSSPLELAMGSWVLRLVDVFPSAAPQKHEHTQRAPTQDAPPARPPTHSECKIRTDSRQKPPRNLHGYDISSEQLRTEISATWPQWLRYMLQHHTRQRTNKFATRSNRPRYTPETRYTKIKRENFAADWYTTSSDTDIHDQETSAGVIICFVNHTTCSINTIVCFTNIILYTDNANAWYMCTYSLSSPVEKGAVFLRKDRHFTPYWDFLNHYNF